MTIFGYARVSTDGQSVDAQVKQLRDAGAEKIFRETASGAKNRRELARAIKSLDEGDTLLVTRLDRLARSTRDLLNALDTIAKAGAGIPIAWRRMGGHHDGARSLKAYCAWRACRVRA
jgi:DNA invertase Pin-like site-specific DNA recombinase